MAKLIGTAPNQVPTNGDLGSMAFEDKQNYVTRYNPIYQPYRNLIINGDMSIAQRGTSFSYNTNSAYNLDRFIIDNTSGAVGNITVTQESDAPSNTALSKSLKITPNATETQTGGMNTVLCTSLEGYSVAPLQHGQSNPPQATLSFWVKSNKTGTYSVQIKEEGIVGEQYVLFGYTINSSNTWERKTFTWTGNSTHSLNYDNSEQFRIVWSLACGPDDKTSATTTWTTSTSFLGVTDQVNFLDNTSNEWYITGVQLEVGTSASDFEFLPYDVNLQRCQRYFEKFYKIDGTETVVCIGAGVGSTQIFGRLNFKTEKRTRPSGSVSSFSHIQVLSDTAAAWSSATGGSLGNGDLKSIRLNLTGLTTSSVGGCHEIRINDSNGYIFIDAEL